MLKRLKERFKKNRSSSNILWKGIFLARDNIEQTLSYILDLRVMLFKKSKKLKVKEIGPRVFKSGVMGKYSYFGEFGYFQFSVLGGLSQYFKIYPNRKVKIITYKNYAKILELAFPKNIKAYYVDYKFDETYRACHYYQDRRFRMTIKKMGFGKNIAKDFIYKSCKLSKIQFDSGGDFFFHMLHPLKYSLGKKEKKFISIFPRFRKTCTDRNLSEEEWNKIIKLLLKYDYKIIVHNYSSEFIRLKDKNLIYSKNIYEQIAYLNNSVLCITPFSGFQHFAENCCCDLFVILNPNPQHLDIFKEHKKFNPFGTKIYNFKENADYLLELQKILETFDQKNKSK